MNEGPLSSFDKGGNLLDTGKITLLKSSDMARKVPLSDGDDSLFDPTADAIDLTAEGE